MKNRYEFRRIVEFVTGEEISSVEMKFTHVTLEEIIGEFKLFLMAAGFHPDNLEQYLKDGSE